MPQEPDRLLTTSEAATLLQLSPSTVVNYANAGALKVIVLPSGHRRFRREDVEALLDPNRAA